MTVLSSLSNLLERGGVLMVPILLCSVLVVAIALERAIFFVLQARPAARRQADEGMKLVSNGRLEEARSMLQVSDHYLGRLLASGLVWRDTACSPSEALRLSALRERRRMQRFLGTLETTITAAPLLGILGTVVGIMQTFEALDRSGVSDPKAVSGGIGVALVTTAAGLVVALVALFVEVLLRSRIESASAEMERTASAVEGVLGEGQP